MKTWYQRVGHSGQYNRSFLVSVLGFNLVSVMAISAALADSPRGSTPTRIQPFSLAEAPRSQRKRIFFKLPERGVPPSRISGGARSACATNTPYLPLTAITPLTSSDANAEFEMVAPNPVFFVYIPQTSVEVAEFSLKDMASNQTLYEKRIKLTKTGGIAKFTLPSEMAMKMEVNHHYGWFFSLLCDSTDTSSILFVGGGFQPVQASQDFWEKVKATPAKEQPPLYAASGYWIDSIDALIQLRQQHPQDAMLLQDWKDLMKAAKLESLADEPFLTDWYQEVSAKSQP